MKGIYAGLGFIGKTGTKNGETVDSEKLGKDAFDRMVKKGKIKVEKKSAPKKADSK